MDSVESLAEPPICVDGQSQSHQVLLNRSVLIHDFFIRRVLFTFHCEGDSNCHVVHRDVATHASPIG
jgi:hypothetical protein